MRSRSFFVLVSIFVFAGIGVAQRSVTNSDLEGYRDQRLRAEQDLRVNYDKLGFPAPEVLAKREEQRTRRSDELISTLRQHELEENRIATEYNAALAALALQQQQQQQAASQEDYQSDDPVIVQPYGGFGYGGYYDYWGIPGYRRYPNMRRRAIPNGRFNLFPQGYSSGGQYWPFDPSTQRGR